MSVYVKCHAMTLQLGNRLFGHLERYLKAFFCVFQLPRTTGDAMRSHKAELYANQSAIVRSLLSVVRATVQLCDHTLIM